MHSAKRDTASSAVLMLGLAIATSLPGCKRSPEQEASPTAEAEPTPEPQAPKAPPRIQPFDGQPLEAGEGHLADGLVYASVRADRLIPFLQRLPLPPDLVRDLAEIGSAVGMDLRVDDVAQRFGLAPDAVITMTLVRPLDANVDSIRSELARGGAVLEALSRGRDDPPAGPRVIPTSFRTPPTAESSASEPAIATPPIEIEPIVPDGPPPLRAIPPEAIASAEKLRRQAAGLGVHMRFHVPARDPAALPTVLEAQLPRGARTTWSVLCSAIPDAKSCVGERDVILIFRTQQDALIVDAIWWAVDGDPDAPTRIAAAREAALAPATGLDVLRTLAGDAAAYVDAQTLPRVAKLEASTSAWNSLEWSSSDSLESTIRHRLERIDSIERQRQAPILFDGIAIEATVSNDRVAARLRWNVASGQANLAKKLLAGTQLHAEVPTLAALCDQAMLCARTRGVPSPSALGDKLATGLYAESARDFQRTWSDGREWSVLQTFISTWPNVMGAASRWPSQEAGSGAEGLAAASAIEAVGRAEGAGASVFSIDPEKRDLSAIEFLAYVRGREAEVDAAATLAGLAGLSATDTEIDGVAEAVRWYELPIGGGLVLAKDGSRVVTDEGPAQYGWVSLVDTRARYAQLDAMPRERNEFPSAYFEIADLWQIVALDKRLARDLGFAQTWLSGRHLRTQLEVEDGQPVATATMARTGG